MQYNPRLENHWLALSQMNIQFFLNIFQILIATDMTDSCCHREAKNVCVQTSHPALMAPNRSSICDIWFHKTINSNREIVNSTQTGCIFPFQTRQPHFTSNCREKANWERSLHRFSINASCSTFLRDGNENSKCSLGIHWLKIELDNIWLEAHGCEKNTDIIQNTKIFLKISLKGQIYISL